MNRRDTQGAKLPPHRAAGQTRRSALGVLGAMAVPALSPRASAQAPAPTTPQLPPGPVEILWPKGAPGAIGKDDADKPAMSVHLPPKDKAVGAAVVVCPGGGYATQAMGHEGAEIAAWLNARGIAAFVLRYRLGHRYRHPAPSDDVKRALRIVRSRAKAYAIAPDRIGVWGFSAGGHLASTAATLFDEGDVKAKDPIDRTSSRPDFAVLCYPVIFMDGAGTHMGSRARLLGDTPAPELLAKLSTDRQVTARTPPVFLFHTTEDSGVPPENSVAFYLALRKAGVPAELHVYEKGRHGVGLATSDPILSTWGARLEDWLRVRGVLPPRS